MSPVTAAEVLIYHLPEITDGAYRTATQMAVESLLDDAIADYERIDHEIAIQLQRQLDCMLDSWGRPKTGGGTNEGTK